MAAFAHSLLGERADRHRAEELWWSCAGAQGKGLASSKCRGGEAGACREGPAAGGECSARQLSGHVAGDGTFLVGLLMFTLNHSFLNEIGKLFHFMI